MSESAQVRDGKGRSNATKQRASEWRYRAAVVTREDPSARQSDRPAPRTRTLDSPERPRRALNPVPLSRERQ